MTNVGKYAIHGAFGLCVCVLFVLRSHFKYKAQLIFLGAWGGEKGHNYYDRVVGEAKS